MASPWKDPRTGILCLRVRVPADLAGKADGRTVALPVGDGSGTVTVGKTFIEVSAATCDPAEGKTRFIAAQAALTWFWLNSPQFPRHRHVTGLVVSALSGQVCRARRTGLARDLAAGRQRRACRASASRDRPFSRSSLE